ncbi:MAG: TlpA disulfide reductase family protein [Alphaproteobacteria bacterium]
MRRLAVAVMVAALPLGGAVAEGQLQLTDEVKARLGELVVLRGDGVGPSNFDGRPVVVTFFASWCPPCAAEFREIGAYIEEEGPDKISVIAVNWIEDFVGPPRQSRFNRMLGLIHPTIPVLKGDARTGEDFGGVLSIPAAYIFDAEGREVFRLGGDAGPHGRHFLRRGQLASVIDGLS